MINKFSQFLGLAKRAGKVLEGYNKCLDGIKFNKVSLVLLSSELSEGSMDKFVGISSRKGISYVKGISKEYFYTLNENKDVNIIGITDKNMSLKLLELWQLEVQENNCFGGEMYDKN